MSTQYIWTIIIVLGLGTYLIRYSFLGILGKRALANWLLRLLRFVPVAVLPGLVAPLVMWPTATGGIPDPARLAAAAMTLLIGAWLRSVLGAIIAGMAVLYLVQYWLQP